MEYLKIGKNYKIHSYKHNGDIYKAWDEAILLHYDFKNGILIFGNNCTTVTEKDGHTWKTKEPAVLYFFLNRWFNIIGQYKQRGIYYYCNMASPIIIEDNTIKYIDYDLDLKVFPNGSFKILDKNEYKYHKNKYAYPVLLDKIIKKQLSDLINEVRTRDNYFKDEQIEKWVKIYLEKKAQIPVKRK
ncbi:MAG TPA: DUF402 domain-containing protein [Candidatus Onthousia faecavium]|nr:DUF402 domain-containing protein [Candidatus Onthousia faecavium]